MQLTSYGAITDLQCLHAMRMSSYDLLRQLAWEPSPQITMLCANFFHSMTPSAIQGDVNEEEVNDEEGDGDKVDPTEKKLTQIFPLESHIKTLLSNPSHRSRRQVLCITDI